MFIWGSKGSVQKIGYLMQECPSCKSGPFAVHQAKKKFTIYFIPTFSYSNKQYLECLSCHDSFEVAADMKPDIEQNLLTQAEFSALARNNSLAEPDSDNPRYREELGASSTTKSEGRVRVVPTSAGSPVSSVPGFQYCSNCGENQPLTSNFCNKCGAALSNSEAT